MCADAARSAALTVSDPPPPPPPPSARRRRWRRRASLPSVQPVRVSISGARWLALGGGGRRGATDCRPRSAQRPPPLCHGARLPPRRASRVGGPGGGAGPGPHTLLARPDPVPLVVRCCPGTGARLSYFFSFFFFLVRSVEGLGRGGGPHGGGGGCCGERIACSALLDVAALPLWHPLPRCAGVGPAYPQSPPPPPLLSPFIPPPPVSSAPRRLVAGRGVACPLPVRGAVPSPRVAAQRSPLL